MYFTEQFENNPNCAFIRWKYYGFGTYQTTPIKLLSLLKVKVVIIYYVC